MAERRIGFTKRGWEQYKRIATPLLRPGQKTGDRTRTTPHEAKSGVKIQNNTGAVLPPRSVVMITEAVEETRRNVWTVVEPDGSVQPFFLVTDKNIDIADGHSGRGWLWGQVEVNYDDSGADPAPGETWGPKSGEIKLFKDLPGYMAVGANRDGYGVFVQTPSHILVAKTDAAHAIDDTGTVSVWTGVPGSETDSGINVEAFNYVQNFGEEEFVFIGRTPGGWYIIGGGAAPAVVMFELTATLALGGTAAAKILPSEEVITVEDPTDADPWFSGLSGFRGFAIFPPGATNYQIIWMEEAAPWITGFLAENMGATTPSEANADNIEGQGGRLDITSASDVIIVHDPRDFFKFALNNAKFKANWNKVEGRYELVQCAQRAMHIRFQCQGTVAANTPSFTADNIIVLDGGQDPGDPLTVYNVESTKNTPDHIHTGDNDATGEAWWNPDLDSGDGGYEVAWIEC